MKSNNKRLVINSIALYLKLSISILIGIFSSRIVLDALGVSNYGLFNVVGGIVTIMNTVAFAMHSVVYRYISIEIGKGKNGNVSRVFSLSLNIFVFFALLLIIVGYPIGRFYINNYLNVNGSSITDAHFVFTISILASSVSLISIPFSSVLIACEKFLFTSFFDILLKIIQFGFVIWMSLSTFNHLIFFSYIVLFFSIASSLSNIVYDMIFYRDLISYNWIRSLKEYKDIGAYSIWILLGSIAVIFTNQGAGVLINSLWGLSVNASYGLANQVYNYLMQFVRNLTQAASPQIIKSFEGDQNRAMFLVYTVSKYSFFLLFAVAYPVVLNLNSLLAFWLVDVPDYLYEFIIFMIINGLLWCVANGFDTSIQASGKIRFNQIAYTIITLSLLPLIVVFAKLGFPPYVISIINASLFVMVIIMQCYVMKNISQFNIKDYLKYTIMPCVGIILLSIPYGFIHYFLLYSKFNIIILMILSLIISIFIIFLGGLNEKERKLSICFLKSKF